LLVLGGPGTGMRRVDERAQDDADEPDSTLPEEAVTDVISVPRQHGTWLRDFSLGASRAFAALLSVCLVRVGAAAT